MFVLIKKYFEKWKCQSTKKFQSYIIRLEGPNKCSKFIDKLKNRKDNIRTFSVWCTWVFALIINQDSLCFTASHIFNLLHFSLTPIPFSISANVEQLFRLRHCLSDSDACAGLWWISVKLHFSRAPFHYAWLSRKSFPDSLFLFSAPIDFDNPPFTTQQRSANSYFNAAFNFLLYEWINNASTLFDKTEKAII